MNIFTAVKYRCILHGHVFVMYTLFLPSGTMNFKIISIILKKNDHWTSLKFAVSIDQNLNERD